MNSADGGESYESTADLYDHVVPYRKRPDVSFYVEAATEAGSPVLEVGCGTGRVLIPTALAGTAIHTREFAAAAVQPLAHAGMLAAAKAMAMTTYDLLADPGRVRAAKAEFARG